MTFVELWKKLFTRNNEIDEISLVSAGATVRHRNPFENIEVPRNKEPLSRDFVDKWVAPFYMNLIYGPKEEAVEFFVQGARDINSEIVHMLLGDFNWRTRTTGAFFAAVNNYNQFQDIIGRHLLKSEVCFAGNSYCLALATFGGEKSTDYLSSYLNYYLERIDLWFDQASAFCALEYLDKNRSEVLLDKWNLFVSDKQNWNLENFRQEFSNWLRVTRKIRDLK